MDQAIEQRISKLENEMVDMRQTLRVIDDRTRIQEREQVRTQTMVEGLQNDMKTVHIDMSKLSDGQQRSMEKQNEIHAAVLQNANQATINQESRWAKFWERMASGLVTGLITILGTILIAKYVHF